MTKPPAYLAQHGKRLIASGYEIVPIAPGKKFPLLRNWQTVEPTQDRLAKWLANGHARDGVGIRAAHTPAIDIDVLDPAMAASLEAWCQANIGFAPVRVGRAPKRLLVYRAEAPFPKQVSTWIDRDGREQKLEVLGDGQQFVAWAVHPETGRPYDWTTADTPLTVERADLEPLSLADARRAVAEFDRLAAAAGWRRKAASLPDAGGVAADDDALAFAQDPMEIDDEVLRSYLMAVPNSGAAEADYDAWAAVGMALHHQYSGTDDGLEVWREWSEQSGKHDDATLEAKWRGFKDARGARRVITARHIVHLGKQASVAHVRGRLVELKEAIGRAGSLDDLARVAEEASATDALDALGREALEGALRAAFRRIEGSPMTVAAARGMLKPKQRQAAGESGPNWLRHWVYLAGEDVFYHKVTGERVTKMGFDAKYDRYMLSVADKAEGKTSPSSTASDFALKGACVDTPHGTVYLPGEDEDIVLAGRQMVNSYRPSTVPAMPETLSAKDLRNIEVVKGHFVHLIEDERERGLLLSFLAYGVQTLKRPNWAVLLQGTEGDGKTFVSVLMGAVHGSDNVKAISPATLGHPPFTEWAEGALVATIEEVKLHGHNRHDVLNAIKPVITNDHIEIHPKGSRAYMVPNTQAYILLTNYADALPLNDHDSRYFILNTRYQSQKALMAFKAANPLYFDRLFAAIDESAGALRRWLMDYKLHPEFKPKARAPWSKGRDYMARMAQSDEADSVGVALSESLRVDVTADLLCQSSLSDEIERLTGHVLPAWMLKRQLSERGFHFLGRLWFHGRHRLLWSQTPRRWETRAPGQLDRVALDIRLKEDI